MGHTRVLSVGVSVGFLLAVSSAFPPPARAAWVNGAGTQFQVGGAIQFNVGGQLTTTITPTAAGTSFADPTCGSQGGTSLALVQGSKLKDVNSALHPLVLVVSCLDNGGSATIRSRLNFINPADGKVIKQISTTAVPSNGWAHLVHRPDKGDLLGCGDNGALYSIDFSQFSSTADGTATLLPQVATSCKGLAWDAEADMIYQGLAVGGGTRIGRVVSFKDGTTTLLGDFTNLPCAANGLAISGGVLLMSCDGALDIRRLDKNTGASLGVYPTLTATGLTALNSDPGLGDLACDPVSFQKDASGKDLYTDAMWSRRGANGNGVVALEFPAFTCGLPSNSVVYQNGVPFSPLAAGLSKPGPNGPGELPLQVSLHECFDTNGNVIDSDGDGLPDCWEDAAVWFDATRGIDFDGNGVRDIELCVQVDTNGDGVPDATECADPSHKDLFVYIDYMQDHKPDPQALSQTQSVSTAGVKSVREAFAAAPVTNPDTTSGIRIHFQIAAQPVTFTPVGSPLPTSHVNQVALTPCTKTANDVTDTTQSVDFDTIKAANFGTVTVAERAKRLAFRYVLFAHNLVELAGGGAGGSGCAEVAGDDAVVTLGSFATTTVDGVSHARGNTDQQAGTFMHEFGHLLGLRHGGHDGVNCKPNYRSVMSYPRQFAGSPITNRRLDYSRSEDPDLNEAGLNECSGIGSASSLGPISLFFPSADKIAYGPNAWSVVTPWPLPTAATSPCTLSAVPINWNRQTSQGKVFQTSASADINGGATTGCETSGAKTLLEGHDDWSHLLYRASASLEFAGGGRSETPQEMTKENEAAFFQNKDTDGNGVGDGVDCGGTIDVANGTTSFPCTHHIDIKPSFPVPKTLDLGTEANVTIAIFSEKNGTQVWNAPAQVLLNDLVNFPLTFSVESFVVLVKTNNKGGGTCSISDVADPDPLIGKDGIKDLKCQFPTGGLPTGTHFGVVSGFFFDPLTNQNRAFSARQEVIILP